MTLNKAIEHGKEKRKAYTGDPSDGFSDIFMSWSGHYLSILDSSSKKSRIPTTSIPLSVFHGLM